MSLRRDVHGAGDPDHASCPDPAHCDCECLPCKRAWFAAGRPRPTDPADRVAPVQLWWCPQLDLLRTVERVDRSTGFTSFVEKHQTAARTRTGSLVQEWRLLGTAGGLSAGVLVRAWPWPESYACAESRYPELALPPWDGRVAPRPTAPPVVLAGDVLVRLSRDFDLQLTTHAPHQTRKEAAQCPRPDFTVLQLAPRGRGFKQR